MAEHCKGLVIRDFKTHPVGYCCTAFGDAFPAMSDSEIDDRLELMEKEKATLLDIRNIGGPNGGPIPSTDQNGSNYCWAHSTVSSMLLARAKQNLPYINLNAYSIASPIKGGRNEGGWCQQSVKFAVENGCSTMETWPFQQMSVRNWTEAAKTEAKLYRIIEWYDGGDDPRLWWTALAMGMAPVSDYNDWMHSVCAIHGSRRNKTSLIWNSWGDGWGTKGIGRPQSRTPHPQNWMVPRIVTA